MPQTLPCTAVAPSIAPSVPQGRHPLVRAVVPSYGERFDLLLGDGWRVLRYMSTFNIRISISLKLQATYLNA